VLTIAIPTKIAVRIFKKDGMKVRPFPCAYLVPPSRKKMTWFFLVPNTDALNLWNVYLKEQVGNIVVKITKG
jgi:hypothetical protein